VFGIAALERRQDLHLDLEFTYFEKGR